MFRLYERELRFSLEMVSRKKNNHYFPSPSQDRFHPYVPLPLSTADGVPDPRGAERVPLPGGGGRLAVERDPGAGRGQDRQHRAQHRLPGGRRRRGHDHGGDPGGEVG